MREVEVIFPKDLTDLIEIYDVSTHEDLLNRTNRLVFGPREFYADIYKVDENGYKYNETIEDSFGVYIGPAMERAKIVSVKVSPGCTCDSQLLAIAGCQCGKG